MSFAKYLEQLLKKILVPKKLLSCILFAVMPAMLFYGVSLFVLRSSGFSIMEILRDPAQQSGESSFIGFLSNIGIWLWISSAAISFFTFIANTNGLNKHFRELILLMGTLSLLLGIDDFFLIHDRYIDQKICYFVYAVLAGSLLMRHYDLIFEIEGFAFIFACSLLGLSIFTDLIQDRIPLAYEYTQVFEEGFKFLGAATWLYASSRIASFRPPSSALG